MARVWLLCFLLVQMFPTHSFGQFDSSGLPGESLNFNQTKDVDDLNFTNVDVAKKNVSNELNFGHNHECLNFLPIASAALCCMFACALTVEILKDSKNLLRESVGISLLGMMVFGFAAWGCTYFDLGCSKKNLSPV